MQIYPEIYASVWEDLPDVLLLTRALALLRAKTLADGGAIAVAVLFPFAWSASSRNASHEHARRRAEPEPRRQLS